MLDRVEAALVLAVIAMIIINLLLLPGVVKP